MGIANRAQFKNFDLCSVLRIMTLINTTTSMFNPIKTNPSNPDIQDLNEGLLVNSRVSDEFCMNLCNFKFFLN